MLLRKENLDQKVSLRSKTVNRVNHTSIIEEIFNIITHGLGIVLSIIGLVVLFSFENKNASLEKIIGLSVFGAVIIFSYSISTLYHSLMATRAKKVFKILDHSSIFLLIAGTYTPFLLVGLKGKIGLILLFSIWAFAILGIVLKIFYVHRFKRLSLVFYLFMGWFIVFGIKPLLDFLPIGAIFFLALGGLSYTFGIAFYLFKRLPFNHVVWHIFVLCGSVFHFFAMFYL